MSRTITLERIESSGRIPPLPNQIPILRLRLNQKASSSMFSLAGVKKMARSFMSKLTSEDEDVKLEEAASPESTRKNKEKLRKYIGAIQDDLQKRFEEASDSLEGKTPEQQEQIVAYWTAVTDFLQQVLDWLQKLFLEVIELIKQGHTIEKDALKKMFAKAADAVKQAFNNQLSVDEADESVEMLNHDPDQRHQTQQPTRSQQAVLSGDPVPYHASNLQSGSMVGGNRYGQVNVSRDNGSARILESKHLK